MLAVLISTISNSHVFLLKKKNKKKTNLWIAFTSLTFNISVYAIFNDQSLNNTLTKDIVSFEQMGPDLDHIRFPDPQVSKDSKWYYNHLIQLGLPVMAIICSQN